MKRQKPKSGCANPGIQDKILSIFLFLRCPDTIYHSEDRFVLIKEGTYSNVRSILMNIDHLVIENWPNVPVKTEPVTKSVFANMRVLVSWRILNFLMIPVPEPVRLGCQSHHGVLTTSKFLVFKWHKISWNLPALWKMYEISWVSQLS